MMKRLAVLPMMVLVLLVTMGARSPKPMYMPEPTPVPEGVTVADATKAVNEALAGRGWIVEDTKQSDGENMLTAKLLIRVHMVKIKILVTEEKISIEYVDSTEMRYKKKKGKPYIHPKYTQWIQSIESDLRGLLLVLAS